ncbi:MAG: thioredoxin-disulfide reductase, partial [Dehalococcoidia bacterium]|nr:thioredoxin-disulfide reductase [Dehalococcoidia bacterium]
MHRKVIIIGSGPAGLTAAVYAARANLEPLVFEGSQPGGQLTITTDVENFPGFPDGIMGPELIEHMRKQAVRFGATCEYKTVDSVDLLSSPFTIWVKDEKYTADTVIISTGASARLLGLDSEKELMGYGVSACATCDGFFFKEKEVLVVGGGDSAAEEAIFLTKFASKVSIIHRRDELRASKIMQDRVFKNKNIEIMWNSNVEDISGTKDSGVTGATIKDTVSGDTKKISCDGVFMAIGHIPNTSVFKAQLDLDDKGYII